MNMKIYIVMAGSAPVFGSALINQSTIIQPSTQQSTDQSLAYKDKSVNISNQIYPCTDYRFTNLFMFRLTNLSMYRFANSFMYRFTNLFIYIFTNLSIYRLHIQ